MAQLIGVTGGIGAGKTTVLEELQKLGQLTLDSDSVVHELYRPESPVTGVLRERWGDIAINPDGSVNRKEVASRVFNDPEQLAWLNRLIHPKVKQVILQHAAAAGRPLYCAIPLLFEVGWENEIFCTATVWCSPETQAQRLSERGWRNSELQERLHNQLPMDTKLERADFGIINNGNRAVLIEQIRGLLSRVETLITTKMVTYV